MKLNKQAFTLIELLVVVLIIGVLAAVALPQYQLAVAKSRASLLFPLIKSIDMAQEIYFLANGHYSESFTDLDIELPSGGIVSSDNIIEYDNFKCWLYPSGEISQSIYCQNKQKDFPQLEKYWNKDSLLCWFTAPFGGKICKLFPGKMTTRDNLYQIEFAK